MKRIVGAIFFLTASMVSADVFKTPRTMVVVAPVADIRSEPEARKPVVAYDPKQETQVERGEPVVVFERKGPWARVEASDQPEYTHNDRWQGYPGWILWSALGSDLKQIVALKPLSGSDKAIRKSVLSFAERHLGESYLWGGRSLCNLGFKETLTGVDCSGLVNWSFRQAGYRVARDSHEQYMQARPVEPSKLQPGDLFFLAKTERRDRVVHVGFYAGADDLLEAPQTGEKVRRLSFKERFGKPLAELHQGEVLGDRVIYFGTLIPEGK